MPDFNPYSNYNEPRIQADPDYIDSYAFNYGANFPATDIDTIPTPLPTLTLASSGTDWKKLLLIAGAALVVVKVL